MTSRRVLFVHAHPDDETINNGATMARYVAEGAAVTMLTCTLGEEGEILVPEVAELASDHADQLGGYRIGELRAAMAAVGVTDMRFLGGAGRYRDSGMMGTPANEHPRAFWNADLDEAVAHAVAVVREAISNAVRHGRATSVTLTVGAGAELVVDVLDDGVGIGPDQARSGLRNLEQRAGGHGGQTAVEALPDGGTRLRWSATLR